MLFDTEQKYEKVCKWIKENKKSKGRNERLRAQAEILEPTFLLSFHGLKE